MSLNYYYFYIHFYIYLAISSYYCIHLSHAQQASCAYGEYYNATSNKCYQCDCSHWMMSNGHNKIACDTAPEGTAEFYGYQYKKKVLNDLKLIKYWRLIVLDEGPMLQDSNIKLENY